VSDVLIDVTESLRPAHNASAPAVETVGLTKRYGDLFAVRDLNLTIPRGSIFGLIGPNGAGKTTTMAILASLLRPTAGRALVVGLDPATQTRAVRRVVGYMPDVLGVYDDLRVQEYLEFFAAAYKLPRGEWRAVVDGLLELVDLTGKRNSVVHSLSRGMKQRLSLARALVHDPEVLILDEPASGLDPRARIDLRNLMLELQRMGKTVVISSHILPELQEVCTDVAIMEVGRLLAAGPPRTILDRLGGTRTIRVRLAGGEELTYTADTETSQAALLRRLVEDEGLAVVEFTPIGDGLEDLFLAITKGVVQ